MEASRNMERIELFDISGHRALTVLPHGSFSVPVSTEKLHKGIWMVRITFSDGTVSSSKVVIR